MFTVLATWPLEWCAPDVVVCDETEIQKQKVVAKWLAQHKWNEQLAAEGRVSREAAKATVDKAVAIVATTT